MAGAGALAGLFKVGLIWKLYLLFSLIRLTTFGGVGALLGAVALVGLIGAGAYRFRRRIHQ